MGNLGMVAHLFHILSQGVCFNAGLMLHLFGLSSLPSATRVRSAKRADARQMRSRGLWVVIPPLCSHKGLQTQDTAATQHLHEPRWKHTVHNQNL